MPRTLAVALIFLFACDLPRDAGDTLEHVQGGTLRAGAVLHPPWVVAGGDELSGVDVRLVQILARDLGAHVSWVRGTESALMTSLKQRELDIVVGGLPADASWKKEVGTTRPYYTDSTMGLLESGGSDFKGKRVQVEAGDPAAVFVRKKGGVPVLVNDLTSAGASRAAPAWRLAALGAQSGSSTLLHKTPRIMAVAPGENAWLMRIDRELLQWKDSVPQWLRAPVP
jgi:ABC-type amino acid transport substrate-binding protein